jgi:hypothetical protein
MPRPGMLLQPRACPRPTPASHGAAPLREQEVCSQQPHCTVQVRWPADAARPLLAVTTQAGERLSPNRPWRVWRACLSDNRPADAMHPSCLGACRALSTLSLQPRRPAPRRCALIPACRDAAAGHVVPRAPRASGSCCVVLAAASPCLQETARAPHRQKIGGSARSLVRVSRGWASPFFRLAPRDWYAKFSGGPARGRRHRAARAWHARTGLCLLLPAAASDTVSAGIR